MKRPLSMTAFGRGEAAGSNRQWIVEIRSVNHRFCDIKIKMPRQYAALEEKIKKEISKLFSRGHIEVFVTLNAEQSNTVNLKVNLPLAREYHACLLKINQALGLHENPSLESVAAFKDVITAEEPEEDLENIWGEIKCALLAAIESCMQMRQDEGSALSDDLLSRVNYFADTVNSIEQQVPDLVIRKKTALQKKLDDLLEGIELDPMRLAQEVAIISDKSDITEEIVRLNSHISQFKSIMDMDEPIGRRLDFLLQEFLREINTMASKINDSSVTHKTVELKNEAEKMREQVQNIE